MYHRPSRSTIAVNSFRIAPPALAIVRCTRRLRIALANARHQPRPKADGCMPKLYARLLRMYIGVTCMTRLSDIVRCDPDVLGGMPVFAGTRVPIQSLFDYLEGGETLDEFLRQFPSVKRDQTIAALDLARATLLACARSSLRATAARPRGGAREQQWGYCGR